MTNTTTLKNLIIKHSYNLIPNSLYIKNNFVHYKTNEYTSFNIKAQLTPQNQIIDICKDSNTQTIYTIPQYIKILKGC